MANQKWFPSTLFAAVVGLSLIICCVILSRAVIRVKSSNELIRVTGSARKQIRSDFIIWKGRVVARGTTIAEAYAVLSDSMQKTKAYLESKGVPKNEILDRPIETQTLYAPPTKAEMMYPGSDVYRKPEGYELTQEVEVRSTNVDLVDGLARKATELISSGVAFESEPPEYIYTKLGEMKVTMLAEAAKDARGRAEQIATNSGCRLGEVRYARMSPLRITPAYAVVEVDEWGTNDTTSLDKDITAVVSVSYAVH